jgi:ABC-2 type transport system permease protein
MISAILRAQWLSLRPTRRGAILTLFTAVLWYGFWSVLAVMAGLFASDPQERMAILRMLPRGLMLIFLYWQLAPLASASLGASLDLRKLMAYPIPHQALFRIEVLLRLTTAAEMLLILLGGLLGLCLNPAFRSWESAPRIAAAFAVFALFNLLLSAGMRNLLERMLARKHVREVVVLILVLMTAAPRLLMASGFRWRALEDVFAAVQQMFWPWSAAAHAALGPRSATGAAALAVWTLIAWAFGRTQFERSLRYDPQAVQATDLRPSRSDLWVERLYRLPGLLLPDPLGAMVEKELRSLSRTPRFRLVFIMGFSFGLLVWLPIIMGRRRGPSALSDNFLILVSVYALTLLGQVSYWNAFGFDRSAVQVYFSLPVPVSKTLAGKNIAAALFILLELAAVTVACLLLRVRIPPLKILEAFVITPVAALYFLAIGNLSSVHYPRPMNPDKVSQGGAASRFQALLLIVYPLALLPLVLAYVARSVFDNDLIFWGLVVFAAAVGAVVYWISMESAVAAAQGRREALLAELSGGEGPVAAQ